MFRVSGFGGRVYVLAPYTVNPFGHTLEGLEDICLQNGSSQGHTQALTVLFVPNSLDRGSMHAFVLVCTRAQFVPRDCVLQINLFAGRGWEGGGLALSNLPLDEAVLGGGVWELKFSTQGLGFVVQVLGIGV